MNYNQKKELGIIQGENPVTKQKIKKETQGPITFIIDDKRDPNNLSYDSEDDQPSSFMFQKEDFKRRTK